jgi:hypothetical protein
MDSNKPALAQVGGTKVSRRTIARGAAWSVPIAAVATSAPAFAASCVPQIVFSPGSCKCPGNSHKDDVKAYYVGFCLSNECQVGSGSGGEWRVVNIFKDNDADFGVNPNACFPATVPTDFMPVDECTDAVFRLNSKNSANYINVTFETKVGGVTTEFTQQLANPPHCTDFTDGRCEGCV